MNESSLPGESRTSRLWLFVFLLIYAGQCLWFIGTQSFTYDEPTHLIAGIDGWQNHRFYYSTDHPPLPRLLATLPLPGHAEIDTENFTNGFLVRNMVPDPVRVAWTTRPMILLLGIGLGLAVWFATRALISEGAANFALALFAFSPDLIAHFSMTTTDGAGALFVFLGAWQFVRWKRLPNWPRTLQLGLVLGGMILAKFYGGPLAAIAVVIVLLSGARFSFDPRQWRWKQALAIVGIMLVVIWGGYFFHVSRLNIDRGHLVATFPNRPPTIKDLHWKGTLHLIVPAGEFVEGLRLVSMEVHRGRPGWFLGKLYPKGTTHWYYPAAMVLKWPLLVLACFVAGATGIALRKIKVHRGLGWLLLFPAVYLCFALTSRYNIGVRHVLPLYPFVLVLAGATWEILKRHRHAILIAVLLVTVNGADVLRYAPGYLSYFNVFIPRDQGWKYLSDSNVDWGQGLRALREYQMWDSETPVHLAYFGGVDPALYGIRYQPLLPHERVTGKVVISMSYLSGQVLDDPDSYGWMLAYKPVAVIDHSMYVYDIR